MQPPTTVYDQITAEAAAAGRSSEDRIAAALERLIPVLERCAVAQEQLVQKTDDISFVLTKVSQYCDELGRVVENIGDVIR